MINKLRYTLDPVLILGLNTKTLLHGWTVSTATEDTNSSRVLLTPLPTVGEFSRELVKSSTPDNTNPLLRNRRVEPRSQRTVNKATYNCSNDLFSQERILSKSLRDPIRFTYSKKSRPRTETSPEPPEGISPRRIVTSREGSCSPF